MTYCGPPPLPADLLGRWNLDPWLLGVMTLSVGGLWLWSRRGRGARPALLAAVTVLVVAFVSPLCALSSALFSARIAHHLLLVAVAAPLIAWAAPAAVRSVPLTLTAVAQAAALWFWHATAPYQAAMSDPLLYWIMELSLLATAVLFWSALMARRDEPLAALGGLAATMAQMGVLGAVLTFAPEPLYAPHLRAPLAFGLTALEDQQLAGLLMWAPGAVPYAAAALAMVARLLNRWPEASSWRG